jgi:hypothetical protein
VDNGDSPENDNTNLSILSNGDKNNYARGDMIGGESSYETDKIDVNEGDQNHTYSPSHLFNAIVDP